jgi:hypothetical protein
VNLTDATVAPEEAGADPGACVVVPGIGVAMASCHPTSVACERVVGFDHVVPADVCTEICSVTQYDKAGPCWSLGLNSDGRYDASTEAGIYECGPCNAGRRPEGFEPSEAGGPSAVGAFFAHVAELEAASVDAFEILAMELEAHDAPPELAAAARDAARDEVRHARVTKAIARRYGGEAPRPPYTPRPIRALAEIARENAVEGCVRETFGALVAMAQAERATDLVIRQAMEGIARDEARHAALAWEVAAWSASRLGAAERGRVQAALHAAVESLAVECAAPGEPELARVAGVPDAELALRLIAGLRAGPWSQRCVGQIWSADVSFAFLQ